jgi:hypothetical protein
MLIAAPLLVPLVAAPYTVHADQRREVYIDGASDQLMSALTHAIEFVS